MYQITEHAQVQSSIFHIKRVLITWHHYVSSCFDSLVLTGHVFSGSVSFTIYCDRVYSTIMLTLVLMDLHCLQVGVAGVKLSVLSQYVY